MLEDIAHPEYLAEEVTNEYRDFQRRRICPGSQNLSYPRGISIMHSKVQIWHWSKIVHYWITIHIVLKIRKGHIPGINNHPANYRVSPECLMYRGCGFSTLNSAHQLSDEQVACYDTLVDLRYKFNFTRLDRGGKPRSDKNPTYLQGLDYNISVPEMLLIKAECMGP